MAYNAASATKQIAPSSMLYNWQNAPFPQSSVADPYAGNRYTGNQNYTPEAADPADYWNEQSSGYDQMPEYGEGREVVPYDVAANYQPQYIDPKYTDWENANRYAPWSNPMGPGGVESANQYELMNDPAFFSGGYVPARNASGLYDNTDREGAMMAGAGIGAAGAAGQGMGMLAGTGLGMGTGATAGLSMFGPLGMAVGAGGGALYSALQGKKKKRQVLDYKQPSYQGYMFTPEEGFPDYYNPSQETQDSQSTQQDLYSQQPTYSDTSTQTQSPQGTSYDYGYTGGGNTGQQSYVGQQDQNYGSLYNNSNNSSLYDMFTV